MFRIVYNTLARRHLDQARCVEPVRLLSRAGRSAGAGAMHPIMGPSLCGRCLGPLRPYPHQCRTAAPVPVAENEVGTAAELPPPPAGNSAK